MILVPPKTLDPMCSALTEAYPVWGVTNALKDYPVVIESSGVLKRFIWVNIMTGDVFCSVGHRLYKQTGGVGQFTLLTVMNSEITCLTGNLATGLLYVGYNYAYSAIKSVNPETGVQGLRFAEAMSDLSGSNGAVVNPGTGEVYWTTPNGVYVSSPYIDDSTEVTTAAHTTAYSNIRGIALDDVQAKLYILDDTGFHVQENFTGAFTDVAFTDGMGITVSGLNQHVYLLKDDGGVYRQYQGAGAITQISAINIPTLFSIHSSTNLWLCDEDSAEPIKTYGNGPLFNTDEYCTRAGYIYVSLSDCNRTTPPSSSWFTYGPTNPGKMFDDRLLTRTIGQEDDLYFTFLGNGDIDTIGLFNITGTTAVLRVFDADGLVDEVTQTITSRNMAFTNVSTGVVYEINITGTSPSCGGVVAGLASDIGQTLWGVNLELVSYSKIALDDFGRAEFTRRGRAKRATFPLWTQLSQVDRLYELFNANDAKFCMWQGDDTADYLLLYGYYKRFDMPLTQLSGVKYSIEVLGDVDTEPETETSPGYTANVNDITRALLLPDGHTVLVWFSNPMTIGTGGSGGIELTIGENGYALTYVAGDPGIVFLFTSDVVLPAGTAISGEYTQPTDGIKNYFDDVALPTDTFTVTNTAASPPTLLFMEVDETGLIFSATFNQSITLGAGGSSGFVLSGSTELSFDRISGATIYFDITNGAVTEAETLTASYTQPGAGAGTGILSVSSLTPLADFSDESVQNNSEATSILTYNWPCMDNAADNVVVCTEDPDKNAAVLYVSATSSIHHATYGFYLNGVGASAVRADSIPAWGETIRNITVQAVFHQSGTIGSDYDVLFNVGGVTLFWRQSDGRAEADVGGSLGASTNSLGTAFSMLRFVVDYDAAELRLYSGTEENDLTLFHTWTNYTPVEFEGPSLYFGGLGANPYSFAGYIRDCKFMSGAVNP